MRDTKLFEKYGLEPKAGKLTPEQVARVKGLGCLRDKRFDDVFNVRVITRNGKITAAESIAIARAAELYGSAEVAMTGRQTVEIQGVAYDNIPALIEYLGENGLEPGGTGPKVRPVVSCKGTTCIYGLIDTYALSLAIHERFYKGWHNRPLPHKFKIAVGGCPNNCVKPDLNDLGVIGQRIFTPDTSKCRGCAKCAVENTCPMKAARLSDGVISIDPIVCNNCGRCVKACPFGVFDSGCEGYKITLGGRWGKKTGIGRPLSRICTSDEEVLEIIEKALKLYESEGVKGERFAETVERLGFEYVENKLICD